MTPCAIGSRVTVIVDYWLETMRYRYEVLGEGRTTWLEECRYTDNLNVKNVSQYWLTFLDKMADTYTTN